MKRHFITAGMIISAFLAFKIIIDMGHSNRQNQIRSTFQKEAIEKGFARYNPQTGIWEWRTIEDICVGAAMENALPVIDSSEMREKDIAMESPTNLPQPLKKKK